MFSQSREKARQSTCASNLKQIALAGLMYAADHHGFALRGATSAGQVGVKNILDEPVPTRGFTEAYYWQSMWAPYVKNSQIFFCPSGYSDFRNAPRYVNTVAGEPIREIWGQYGINYDRLAKARSPWYRATMDSVPTPANTMMVMESWSVSIAVDGSDSPTRILGCGAVGSGDDVGIGINLPLGDPRRGDRHQGRANVAFMDGHIKSVETKDFVSRITTIKPTGNATRYNEFVDYDLSSVATCANWKY